ncbi:MAG TPA: hypothetical protein VKT51_10545 [Candidatus Eremiobacteraceae bacterium]|nr:hypothetical protein [Candidatus Eremiobacteraceae bacterium]
MDINPVPLPPGSPTVSTTTTGTPPPAPGPLGHPATVGEALNNLAMHIPGFAGYKAAEDRRIADKQMRAVIGEHISAVKDRLDRVVDALSRSGKLDSLALIDQSSRKLERLADQMRFADYGYNAVFDHVQIGDAQLIQIYQYDAAIMNEVSKFDGAATAVETAGTDPDRLRAALTSLDALTADFDRRFQGRKHLFDGLPTP